MKILKYLFLIGLISLTTSCNLDLDHQKWREHWINHKVALAIDIYGKPLLTGIALDGTFDASETIVKVRLENGEIVSVKGMYVWEITDHQ